MAEWLLVFFYKFKEDVDSTKWFIIKHSLLWNGAGIRTDIYEDCELLEAPSKQGDAQDNLGDFRCSYVRNLSFFNEYEVILKKDNKFLIKAYDKTGQDLYLLITKDNDSRSSGPLFYAASGPLFFAYPGNINGDLIDFFIEPHSGCSYSKIDDPVCLSVKYNIATNQAIFDGIYKEDEEDEKVKCGPPIDYYKPGESLPLDVFDRYIPTVLEESKCQAIK